MVFDKASSGGSDDDYVGLNGCARICSSTAETAKTIAGGNFTRLLASQSRAFVLVALALALAGIVSAVGLPIGLFPQVSFPRVVVELEAGSRPADQTALLITRPVEEAVRAIPGVLDVRSDTTRGSAQLSIDFGWGRDMTASTLLVDTAVGRTVAGLPPGTTYNVRRRDPTTFPILSYALVSDTVSPVALQDLARYQLTPLLSGIPGLARVAVDNVRRYDLYLASRRRSR